jgi:hypothetical protein
VDLTLAHTLIPIALTSQNAIANKPQIWFSCSKEFSTYYLKDVVGATSAAPTHFSPKFIKVQNETQANAPDCKKYSLERKDGECQSRHFDGGLFANSAPSLIQLLLNQVILNQTTTACSRYNIFNRTVSSPAHFQVTPSTPDTPSKLSLDGDIDITIVTIGTGYFIAPQIPTAFFKTEYLAMTVGIVLAALSAICIFSTAILNVEKQVATLRPQQDGYTDLGNVQQDGNAAYDVRPLYSPGMKLLLLLNVLTAFASVATFSQTLYDGISPIVHGYINIIENGLTGSILSANEAKDITVARDVSGSITITTAFPDIKHIPLDATDAASLNSVIEATRSYVENNSAAFNNLTACLLNTNERTPECDSASRLFNTDFIDTEGRGIIGIPEPTAPHEELQRSLAI